MPDKNKKYTVNPIGLARSINKRRNITYKMGAKGENNQYDCSGFVCSVLKEQGITVGGTSEQIYSEAPIKLGQFEPYKAGDIVAFDYGQKKHDKGRPLGIDHIGVVSEENGKLYLVESTANTGGFSKKELIPELGRRKARGVKIFPARYNTDLKPTGTRWVDAQGNQLLNKHQKMAMEYFIGKGIPITHSAAIVGNMMQESGRGIDPTITNSIGAFGSMQWMPTRKKALDAFAKKNGRDVKDFQTQLDFAYHEFQTTEKDNFQKFLKATDVGTAAKYFERYVERAGEYGSDSNIDKKALNNRVKYATEVFQNYTGGFSSNSEALSFQMPNGEVRSIPFFKYTPMVDNTANTVLQNKARLDNLERVDTELKEQSRAQRLQNLVEQNRKERAFLQEFIQTVGTTIVEREPSSGVSKTK